MPKYSAKLTNGKTITLEGDEQPTDADFEDAAHGASVELLPEGKTAEQYAARDQGDKHGAQYLADTLRNVFHRPGGGVLSGDLVDQVKGVGSALSTVAGAAGEVGANTGSRLREIVGLDPHYTEGTPNVDALAKMPMAVVQHYGDYLDPEKRAQMVRDHPVGLGLDVAGLVEGAKSATPQAVADLANKPMGSPSAATMVKTAVGGVTGGPMGALKGATGVTKSGFLNRLMKGFGGAADVAPKANVADEAAAALRNATDVSTRFQPPTDHPDVGGWTRGRVGVPPVNESLTSQGNSLLSPESQAHAAALNVPMPTAPVSTSGLDMLTPNAQRTMSQMFSENNPIFRKMQAEGKFSGDRTVSVPADAALPSGGAADPSVIEELKRIMGTSAEPMRSTLDIGRTRGGDPIPSPAPPVSPNAGGRLITNPQPRMSAVDMAAAPAPVEGVSLPQQSRGPSVTMSPKAQAAAGSPQSALQTLEDSMRQREQQSAANRYEPDLQVVDHGATPQAKVTAQAVPSMVDQMKANLKAIPAKGEVPIVAKTASPTTRAKTAGVTPEALYKQLSMKAILSPDEAAILTRLKAIMQGRASNLGLGYAAGGK